MTNLFSSSITIDMSLFIGICIAVGVVLIALVVIIIVLANNGGSLKRADKVRIKNGVRYSVKDNILEKNNDIHVTYQEKDFDLIKGETYTAIKKGALMPGKYTILSSSKSQEKYNIRLGGFVREYSHGDTIVIAEGDTICSVSHSLILR